MPITCGGCGHENISTAKFCAQCGAPLARNCEKCGSAVATSAKFCSECGHAVAVAGPEAQVPVRFTSPDSYTPRRIAEKVLLSRSAVEGERKHVTVLFADLKGSMELLAGRDPEDARRLLDEVLDRMMEAVHWFEGTVNQVMGDGIMALFGAPVAHEDHAVRACYAAVRMQEAVTQWAASLRQAEGTQVQIRVGVNSGEVVVRSIGSDLRMDYSAVGQTTHVAARMEQMAEPGTILISPSTLGLAEGYIQVRPRGAATVKGLREPIDVFEVTGTTAVRSRLQARAGRGLTKFVGRHDELAQLLALFERVRQGQGRVVAVIAEPGLGKSRLYAELLHAPQTNDCLILETGCLSYRRAAAWLPIIELLRAYFQIEPHDEPRKIENKISGRVYSLDELLIPYIAPFLWLLDAPVDDPAWQRLDPPRRRLRALEGVKRLLLRESRVQPVLLVVEDLHWIDTETQTLLNDLIESLPTTRVLLLLNYRPEYQHGWASKSVYQQLRLDPLAPETADALLASLLGHDPDMEPLKRLLIERTDGNPFFLEEAVSGLREAKVLVGEPGAYRLTRRPDTIIVPATVQAILAERIDRLPEEEKRLLQAMAVVGTDVPFPLLREIADAGDEQLRHWLGHLQTGEFLYESRLVPDLEYSFRHAVIHDVAYGNLVHERRRVLHARIVDAIERVHADRLAEHFERLGYHAFRGERWEKAVTYLRQAGLKAHGRFANREAVGLFDQALVALKRLPESTTATELGIDIRLELRSALYPLGEFDRILTCLQEAQALAIAVGDQGREGWVSLQWGDALRQSGRIEEACPLIERAQVLGQACGDVPLEMAANQYLGLARYAAGDFRRSVERLQAVVQASPPAGMSFGWTNAGSRAGFLAVNVSWLARAFAELGDFRVGITYGEQGLALAESVDDPYSRALACIGFGYLYLVRGDLDHAIPLLERGRAATRERSMPLVELQAVRNLGLAYARAGRAPEGLALLEQALHEVDSRRLTVQQVTVLGLLAETYLMAERLTDALVTATKTLDVARERGQRGEETVALRLLADIAVVLNPDTAEPAESHYRASARLAEELDMRPQLARCQLGLGRLQLRQGMRLDAEEALGSAAVLLSDMEMGFWLKQALAGLAQLGRLIIIARDRPALYEHLASLVSSDEGLDIVLDRRTGGDPGRPGPERRGDAGVDSLLRSRGLAVGQRGATPGGLGRTLEPGGA